VAEPTPAKVKRSLYRGDTRVWTHVFTDTTTGDPLDLTDYEFVSEYREDLNRGTVIATATCVVTDGPGGVVVETLTSAQADLLPGQTSPTVKPKVYWDLQSTDGDGNVQTWQYATVSVSGDASDD
jgi:hypothetical protein